MSAALQGEARVGRLLLASEGRSFAPEAIDAAAAWLEADGTMLVLSIARIWGSALGLPNPWLQPSRHEWKAQRDLVAAAIAALEARGVAATGKVVATRNAAGRIVKEVAAGGFEAVVMGADASKRRLVSPLFWDQEPQRVRRLSRLPVLLVGADHPRPP